MSWGRSTGREADLFPGAKCSDAGWGANRDLLQEAVRGLGVVEMGEGGPRYKLLVTSSVRS